MSLVLAMKAALATKGQIWAAKREEQKKGPWLARRLAGWLTGWVGGWFHLSSALHCQAFILSSDGFSGKKDMA